ncbi:hypothetical protein [Nitrosomonas sp. Nm34]|uniref:hypothetical protein n=1 Tax=Nitrosomonas sp. Nm34 TaxID=1881055 RepID=UPI0008EAF657|nr:hypothetical protein [Nitrosomonas sp. Nm34]SFI22364.1 hypothetical protein SAMN05428978_1002139 [Nitrosomonas sp. Nm34]
MGLIKRMLDRIEFSQAVPGCGLPQPGSTRGYAPIQLLLQFMLSVWCSANRFEQTEVTRHHPVLKELFDFKRMAKARATAIALIMHWPFGMISTTVWISWLVGIE